MQYFYYAASTLEIIYPHTDIKVHNKFHVQLGVLRHDRHDVQQPPKYGA